MTSQSSCVLLCLREILSFIVACVRKHFPYFLFFFFPYMVSLTYRALGKVVIFLYFSKAGSFFPYPCLISASRRIKHFKKFPNSSNMEYFWRSQGGHLPPLAPTWLRLCLYPLGDGFEGIPSSRVKISFNLELHIGLEIWTSYLHILDNRIGNTFEVGLIYSFSLLVH